MATTQYIGARYVPLIMGEWDQTQAYEALSVVLYEGNSYTSVQNVPADVEITNTQYWVVSGNYNAQVEAYRRETAANTADITQLKLDVNKLAQWSEDSSYAPLTIVGNEGESYIAIAQVPAGTALTDEAYWMTTTAYNAQAIEYRSKVDDNEADIATLQADVAQVGRWSATQAYDPLQVVEYNGSHYISIAQSPAGTLPTNQSYWMTTQAYQARVKSYETKTDANTADIEALEAGAGKKKLLIIGDSYTSQSYYTQYEETGVVLWPTYLAEVLPEYDISVYAEGGAGFINPGLQNHTFLQLLQQGMAAIEGEIDTLLVYGGTNDRSQSESNLVSAIQEFCNVANGSSHKIKRKIFCIGNSATVCDGNHYRLVERTSMAIQRFYPQGFVNSLPWLIYSPYNLATTTGHPNNSGQKVIASHMQQVLTGAGCDRVTVQDWSAYFKNGFSGSTSQVQLFIDNNVATLVGTVNVANINDTQNHTDPVALPGYLASVPVCFPIYRANEPIGTITIQGTSTVYNFLQGVTPSGSIHTSFAMI